MKTWGLVMVQFLGPKEYIVMNLVTMDSLFLTSGYGGTCICEKGCLCLFVFGKAPMNSLLECPFKQGDTLGCCWDAFEP